AETIVKSIAASPDAQILNRVRVAGDHQVQIEVSFAEVSRTALKEIGISYWAKDKTSNWDGGLLAPGTAQAGVIPKLEQAQGADTLNLKDGLPVIQTPVAGAFGAVFATNAAKGFPFSAALSVLSERGYARTLSEPTLVTLSGQSASFLAGGEF